MFMLSRVAEAIYWMQRYRERAENTARLIDVNLYLAIDAPGNDEQQWEPLIATTGDSELFDKLYGKSTESNALEFLTFDERNPNSILNCLYRSRENGRSIREVITSEMWHELNALYLDVRKTGSLKGKSIKALFDFYTRIRRSCQLFTGIKDTTMSHNEAWHFGRIGNLVERADQSSRILDVRYYILLPSLEHIGTTYDDILWSAVLQSVSGLEMYRKKYHEIHHSYVIDFIVLDPKFPRSIYSCMERTRESLQKITGGHARADVEPLYLVSELCKELQKYNVYDLIKEGLHEYLDRMQTKISAISASISNTYFAASSDRIIDTEKPEPAVFQMNE